METCCGLPLACIVCLETPVLLFGCIIITKNTITEFCNNGKTDTGWYSYKNTITEFCNSGKTDTSLRAQFSSVQQGPCIAIPLLLFGEVHSGEVLSLLDPTALIPLLTSKDQRFSLSIYQIAVELTLDCLDHIPQLKQFLVCQRIQHLGMNSFC